MQAVKKYIEPLSWATGGRANLPLFHCLQDEFWDEESSVPALDAPDLMPRGSVWYLKELDSVAINYTVRY